jgi:4-hydroxy-2-oxoheptanedioate aldolase
MGTRIKELLGQGKLVKVFCLGQLCDPKLVEILGLVGGWDGIWLDQEHPGLTVPQIENAARAARLVGLDSFVRLAPTDYATVMRPMEAGAGGVMAAQVRSAAQAEEVVRWALFHPLGLRGVNGTGVDGSFGTLTMAEYLRRGNADTLVVIQIEHIDALNDVEKIAAVRGVDALFIGPADLSQSMGLVGDWDNPRLWESYARVAKACEDSGIHWGILAPTAAFAQRCVQLGCRLLSVGLDVWAFQRGLKAYLAEYAEVAG